MKFNLLEKGGNEKKLSGTTVRVDKREKEYTYKREKSWRAKKERFGSANS